MDRRHRLFKWIKSCHKGQLIRKTNLPYTEHLLIVAGMAESAAPLTYEVGLCHDLLEKTHVQLFEFSLALNEFGYAPAEIAHIVKAVNELTHHFSKTKYPDLSKKERKLLEDERLMSISADAQSVKYADFLYNGTWMVTHKPKKASLYLRKKIILISAMNEGNPDLRQEVIKKLRGLYTKVF